MMNAARLQSVRLTTRLLTSTLQQQNGREECACLLLFEKLHGRSYSSSSSVSSLQEKKQKQQRQQRKDICSTEEEVLLTGDFIARSLYNRDNGYFSTKDVINHLPGALDFGSMLGEWHYRMAVKQAYDSKLSAWMTPVEIFSPHFSHALAKYISREASKSRAASIPPLTQSKRDTNSRMRRRGGHWGRTGGVGERQRKQSGAGSYDPGGGGGVGKAELVLYEVGGGTGTNALHVLNWLCREDPELYDRTEYTIVEISERLAERQREKVCAVHKNCRVVNADVLKWGLSGGTDPRPCFFLGMEVMDNLPHDKIAWTTPSLSPPRSGQEVVGDSPSRAYLGLDNTSGSNRVDMSLRHSQEQNGGPRADGLVGVLKESEGRKELCEAVVVKSELGGYREVFRPLSDPVIRELVELCPDLVKMVVPPPLGRPRSSSPFSVSSVSSTFEMLGRLFARDDPRPEFRAAFVPTGLLRLMHALRTKLPRHRAILADFDAFPAVARTTASSMSSSARDRAGVSRKGQKWGRERESGAGSCGGGIDGGGGGVEAMDTGSGIDELLAFHAPIVSSRDPASGLVTDHDVYTVPLGSADIFFPTCFQRLSRLHAEVCEGGDAGAGVRRRPGLVMKQGAFLREFGNVAATRTLTGYNPMVEDYRNASVFLSGNVLDGGLGKV